MSAPDIEFASVTKRFGEIVAVDEVSLSIARGAFHSFLGPSGCGKTTSLRLIAGFEQPSGGDVRIGGRSMVGVPAYKRPVNMVFQSYALFPHLTVGENVAYGLRQRKPRPAKAEIAAKAGEALAMVRLLGLETRRVWELSGGQQQRVALARALVNRPTVLLLDEPLAALDRKLRREMRFELQSLQRDVGITFVFVTHDQEEALSMSDSISIMRDGRIVQTGSPRDLYDAPANRYVANFVGESNFFEGVVREAGAEEAAVACADGLALAGRFPKGGKRLPAGTKAVVAVRPEAIRLEPKAAPEADADEFRTTGRVVNKIYLGDQTEYRVASERMGEILVRTPRALSEVGASFQPGAAVSLGWQKRAALVLEDA